MLNVSRTIISRLGRETIRNGVVRIRYSSTGLRICDRNPSTSIIRPHPASIHKRTFHSTPSRLRDNREPDPGGKPIPTDGSYRTVYDDFNNILASDEPQLSVRSMGESNFTLSDGLVCRTGIILMQKQVLLWDPPLLANEKDSNAVVMPSGVGWEDWTDDVWRVFEMASPRPEIVIFGTGKTVLPPPPKVRKFMNSLGIQIEAHNTRNACSTYNLLNEEQRMVAAALLPNIRKPTKRIKTTQKP